MKVGYVLKYSLKDSCKASFYLMHTTQNENIIFLFFKNSFKSNNPLSRCYQMVLSDIKYFLQSSVKKKYIFQYILQIIFYSLGSIQLSNILEYL